MRGQRNGYRIDLNQGFVDTPNNRLIPETAPTLFQEASINSIVIQGDATKLGSLAMFRRLKFDYMITSPPYWSMLRNPGSENQRNRRNKNLPFVYSQDESDLGNIHDYDEFLDLLQLVYTQAAKKLKDRRELTVVLKDVKREHILYPLAWDLVIRLCSKEGPFEYIGCTLWCQDNVGLKPFAVGIHWVSNILHHYCLHFRKRSPSAD